MQVGSIGEAAMMGQPAQTPSPRLARAAHEFEGQMMKELLQPMTSNDLVTGTEDDGSDSAGSGGALGEFASEALGRALSASGGFGIADRILKTLSPATKGGPAPLVTGKMGISTVRKSAKALKG